MNAGSANWNWPEVEAVLAALTASEEEVIVCGGQAVAFWAQHFGLQPVVSQDLDVILDRDGATRIAELLGGSSTYPGRYDMTVLTAVVRAPWQGRRLSIECLSSVPGIETDPDAISERITLGTHAPIRVLHPVALVMAKLHAIRHFDQTERNDEAHLRTAWLAAQRWLSDLVATESPRALRLVHQWHRSARQTGNRRVLDRLQLDWKTLVPIDALEARRPTDPLVARFLAEHWPRLVRE